MTLEEKWAAFLVEMDPRQNPEETAKNMPNLELITELVLRTAGRHAALASISVATDDAYCPANVATSLAFDAATLTYDLLLLVTFLYSQVGIEVNNSTIDPNALVAEELAAITAKFIPLSEIPKEHRKYVSTTPAASYTNISQNKDKTKCKPS